LVSTTHKKGEKRSDSGASNHTSTSKSVLTAHCRIKKLS